MDIDFFWLALGLAALGYFIGDGLKNFKNPSSTNPIESLDEFDKHELLKENEVHWFMGVSKEDAKKLLEEHPDIPHITLNGRVYYPKAKLREWLLNLGD
ncbi:DNA-binding protein [Virgibacillus dakarensis]|uniref:DNA-binding protein n=1 Tax=Virgibacillus dakarensis TaxID=1917889 RepID=UPI000B4418A1|nr:DNA-binding protein [Virgibacillus dakarensis]MBT2216965.1 DNA-binding protein [Virgibacillus dakarensis]MTW87893.1 DNA-binding protein [Virgibacillus dakarensis]